MTIKVEKALLKLQSLENSKYALKFLSLKFFFQNMAKFTQAYRQKNLTIRHQKLIKDITTADNNNQNSLYY